MLFRSTQQKLRAAQEGVATSREARARSEARIEAARQRRHEEAHRIQEALGCRPGYIGPPLATSGLAKMRVIADRSVAAMADFICGANEEDYHVGGVNWGRDLPEPEVADLRNVLEGDPSPDGKGQIGRAHV